MIQISCSSIVPYSSEQMYKLVNNINLYPEFLPGCTLGQILSASDREMIALIEVSRAGIRKKFLTRNTLINNRSIHIQLVDGPFHQLNGEWTFTSLDHSFCKVGLYLDFEFTNILAELTFGKIFKEVLNNMMHSFTNRANEVCHVQYCS